MTQKTSSVGTWISKHVGVLLLAACSSNGDDPAAAGGAANAPTVDMPSGAATGGAPSPGAQGGGPVNPAAPTNTGGATPPGAPGETNDPSPLTTEPPDPIDTAPSETAPALPVDDDPEVEVPNEPPGMMPENPDDEGDPADDEGAPEIPMMPGDDGPAAETPEDMMEEEPIESGPGEISINDEAPGFASVSGGTTGGGTDLASAITVTSMSELQNAASGNQPAIILVEPGDYRGSFDPGANKTIIGVAPGVKITGRMSISGGDKTNIIVRNIAVQGERCNSYDECRAGDDAVYIGNGAHHVWLDHLDISDGQDGNCDATQASDFITVSWTHFHYTYAKEHRFSNLIAGGDDETQSAGKLRITYMNCHWGELVDSRQPRGRFGNIHMLNNYHNTGGGQIHGVGFDMALIAENSVYDENRSIWTDMGSPRGWQGIGNIGSGSGLNDSRGSVFEIPYDYTPMPAEDVVAAVTASECGAGNTCTLAR